MQFQPGAARNGKSTQRLRPGADQQPAALVTGGIDGVIDHGVIDHGVIDHGVIDHGVINVTSIRHVANRDR